MPIVGHKIETTTDDFGQMIRKDCLFVDKSLFIKDFWEGQDVSIITRPRRFGKSINLSMLQHFFAEEAKNEPTAELFNQLIIAQEENGEFLKKHQGKYPVILITFKDLKEGSYDDVLADIKTLIQKLYSEHKAILSFEALDMYDKALFEQYLTGQINNAELTQSLKSLSELLYRAYRKNVIILIDEYDSPLTHAYQHGFLDPLSDFLRNMFSAALKSNSYLEKGLMTGVLRVSKNEMLSGLNNPESYTVLDKKYAQYFGFTEEEMKEIIIRTQTPLSLHDIQDYYNGYQMGYLTMYNPWSTMKCLAEGELEPHWILSAGNQLLKKMFREADEQRRNLLFQLMQGEAIEENVSVRTAYEELMTGRSGLWTLLLFSGYLTALDKKVDGTKFSCHLRIPNKEIRVQYDDIFNEWLKEKIGKPQYDTFLKDLVSGNVEAFTLALSKYLLDSLSVRDVGNKKENFYHGFVAGLVASIGDTHWVDSNKESGYGFFDVMLTPKEDHGTRGIIFEFKHTKKHQSLQNDALKALRQINETSYITNLKRHVHITHALKIGIAFFGKQILSVYQEENLITYQKNEIIWVNHAAHIEISKRDSTRKRTREEIDPDIGIRDQENLLNISKNSKNAIHGLFSKSDMEWYDDNKINALLKYYTVHDANMKNMHILDVLPLEGAITHQLIHDRLMDNFDETITTYYLPLRINVNHWIGLYIDITPGNPQVWWIDPYGGISSQRQDEIVTILNQTGLFDIPLTQNHVHFQPYQLQVDGYNCGPWVIEILRFMRKRGGFPRPNSMNITACRQEHHQALENSLSRESASNNILSTTTSSLFKHDQPQQRVNKNLNSKSF